MKEVTKIEKIYRKAAVAADSGVVWHHFFVLCHDARGRQ